VYRFCINRISVPFLKFLLCFYNVTICGFNCRIGIRTRAACRTRFALLKPDEASDCKSGAPPRRLGGDRRQGKQGLANTSGLDGFYRPPGTSTSTPSSRTAARGRAGMISRMPCPPGLARRAVRLVHVEIAGAERLSRLRIEGDVVLAAHGIAGFEITGEADRQRLISS
jgi:hypothetical protein